MTNLSCIELKTGFNDASVWQEVNALAREAFPPEEYLPPEKLAEMAQYEGFDFLALLDQGKFIGFTVIKTYKDLAYLFFLAISPDCRSKGYGSQALEILKRRYAGKKQTVDLEMLDDSAANSEQRKRRREFYLKNGYKETGLFLSYLGVDYEVLCMDEAFDAEAFKAMMKTIRLEGFNPVYFCK